MKLAKLVALILITTVAVVVSFRYLKKTLSDGIKTSSSTHLQDIKDQYITELVKPAVRYPDRFATARCNDGSPFAFKVEKPKNTISNTWVIYLQGGAYCDDTSFLCKDRTTDLITTLPGKDGQLTAIVANQGIFNHDPLINPNFYNVNKVYAHYCSSDVWTGATIEKRKTSGSVDGWYFSGKTNIDAMMAVLQTEYGLTDSNPETKVLFTGGSAGCFGVDANAENLAKKLPSLAKDGRLMLVSDGCYVPEFENTQYRLGGSNLSMKDVLVKAYNYWGSSINTACENDQRNQGEDPANCFLGATLYPYLTSCNENGLCLPNLVQYSSIDHWAVTNHKLNPKPSSQNTGLVLWQQNTLGELEELNPQWIFSGGNISYHTLLLKDEMWQYQSPTGNTFGDVLNNFYLGNTPQQVIFGDVSQH